MNPNEMSLEECRAWLLERDGWKHHPADTELKECWERGLARVFRNPMPLSLDAIYAAMPKGGFPDGYWSWGMGTFSCSQHFAKDFGGLTEGYTAHAKRRGVMYRVFAPDLLTCWARLCVAMRMAESK